MFNVVVSNESVTAYCKICKAVGAHTVVGVASKKPKRVQCSVCNDEHPYRAQMPPPRKRSVRAAKSSSAQTDASYETLMAGRDTSRATAYAMTSQYAHDDLLDHPSFGLGLVTRVLLDRKITVSFPDGNRTLAHDR